MMSWKTTVVGWATGTGIVLAQIVALLDDDPDTVFNYALLLAGLAAIGLGTLSRDNDKSSEDAGAKGGK